MGWDGPKKVPLLLGAALSLLHAVRKARAMQAATVVRAPRASPYFRMFPPVAFGAWSVTPSARVAGNDFASFSRAAVGPIIGPGPRSPLYWNDHVGRTASGASRARERTR